MVLRAAVIHWQPADLVDKVDLVERAGAHVVVRESEDARRAQDEIERLRPDVVVFWTTWKTAHSRILAGALRTTSWGRSLPILFIEDASAPTPPGVRDGLRATVPDALFDVAGRLPFWMDRLAARQANLASVAEDDKRHLPPPALP